MTGNNENLQRYITEREAYVDRRTQNLVAERNVQFKNVREHRTLDPSPKRIQYIVKMTMITKFSQLS